MRLAFSATDGAGVAWSLNSSMLLAHNCSLAPGATEYFCDFTVEGVHYNSTPVAIYVTFTPHPRTVGLLRAAFTFVAANLLPAAVRPDIFVLARFVIDDSLVVATPTVPLTGARAATTTIVYPLRTTGVITPAMQATLSINVQLVNTTFGVFWAPDGTAFTPCESRPTMYVCNISQLPLTPDSPV
eukprot:EG_transcript_34787